MAGTEMFQTDSPQTFRIAFRICWIGFLAATIAAFAAANSQAAEITLNNHVFTVPDGFEIQLAAGPPLIDRPITACFDEQGRLYASDSSGLTEKAPEQLEKKPHRILRLIDSNGDGVFDQNTVFADKMMFPEGTMWLNGSLYVSAPPSIWKLTDVDNDGTADQREEWFQGKTLTGCANDLHGPYLGPDGWIYWCKGAFAEQNYTVNGKPWKTKASHIFRCRPDGTGIEPVMTGGMDNPVDTVFLPNGDRVFTTTFLVQPGNGQRDGMIHAVYGGIYGKEQGALDGHPRTGELMPVLSHFGAAAPCGLTRYESAVFGPAYQDNIFACQFNMHKVSRHVLTPRGASYASADSDFVVSSNIDFHPTDVLEDADGSLLIVDTGGWYKMCCPTSQLNKPDILGGIYRVRRSGTDAVEDPRGTKLDWTGAKQVFDRLTDARPAVRQRAVKSLVTKASWSELKSLIDQSVAERKSTDPNRQQLGGHLVWLLTQRNDDEARAAIREILENNQDDVVRQIAMNSISLTRDAAAVSLLVKELQHNSPANRRAAAEALGRIGDRSAVPHLLAAAGTVASSTTTPDAANAKNGVPSNASTDRALEHSIIYALIELADPTKTAEGLTSQDVAIRRAALVALDQMEGGELSPEQVTPLLASPEPVLRETGEWIIGHRQAWGTYLADYFVQQLKNLPDRSPVNAQPLIDQDSELEQRLVRFTSNQTIQDSLSKSVLDGASIPPAGRRLALRAMAKAKPKEMPNAWGDALSKLIAAEIGELDQQGSTTSGAGDGLLSGAVLAARELPQAKQPHAELRAALLKIAESDRVPPQTRIDAMAGVAGGMPAVSDGQVELLLASLLPDKPVAMRSAAADAVSKAKLTREQLDRLAETVKSVGPLELDRLLAPFERSTDEQLGLKLIASLKQALALTSLRTDSLTQKLAKYSPAVQQGIAEVVSLVNAEAAQQKQRLEELLPQMSHGDIRRGQSVFNSTKAACTACHRVGYLGGNSGPDLTRIGAIRVERDLLESIIYPSLSFVQSYEPVIVLLMDGRILNGLIRDETATEVALVTGPNQESRIQRADIEEIRPSTTSVMPAGLEKQLTVQELADLVAFLKNAK